MPRWLLSLSLCLVATAVHAETTECVSQADGAKRVEAVPLGLPAPLAPGFAAAASPPGAPLPGLAPGSEHALAAGNVLTRIRLENCLARSSRLPADANPVTNQGAAAFDNTPYRFDMSQGGKRMTADEFAAWMEARGLRVAKGAPKAPSTQPAPAPPDPAAASPKKKKSK